MQYFATVFTHKKYGEIEIPQVPEHLIPHPFMEALRVFKNTDNDEFLDKAGIKITL